MFIVSLLPLAPKRQESCLFCSLLFPEPYKVPRTGAQQISATWMSWWASYSRFWRIEFTTTSVLLIPRLIFLYLLTSQLNFFLGFRRNCSASFDSCLYFISHVSLDILATERPRDLIIPLTESRYIVSAVFSEPIQFSNPIKNGNEVSLAGNEVSLATDGETLNNVGVNGLS